MTYQTHLGPLEVFEKFRVVVGGGGGVVIIL